MDAFEAERVMGSPVGWGATFIGPGVSQLTSPIATCSSTLRYGDRRAYAELEEVKQILEYMCPITISTNLMGLRWCKVLMNATFSGLSTVIGDTFGAVMDDPLGLTAVGLYWPGVHSGHLRRRGFRWSPSMGPACRWILPTPFQFSDAAGMERTKEICRKLWGHHRRCWPACSRTCVTAADAKSTSSTAPPASWAGR